MFDRKKQDNNAAKNDAPPPNSGRKPGNGLPTRTIPMIGAALAVGAAAVVAFTGNNTPKTTVNQQTAQQQQQQQAKEKPSHAELRRILSSLNAKHKAHKSQQSNNNQTGNGSGSLNIPGLHTIVPNPKNVNRKKAVQGNVSASGLVALQGHHTNQSQQTYGSSGSGGQSQNRGNGSGQPPSTASLVKQLSQQKGGMNTAKLAALLHRRETGSAGGARHFLSSTASSAGKGYGPVAHVLPKLKGAVLYPGVMLPATTVTQINTQLPGTVIAQVTNSVYGRNGRIAVPAGSRLVGKYDTSIKSGQTRILVAFQRLIFPSGREIVLGNAQATGGKGANGVKGNVNNHFFTMLGSSLLVALLDQGVASTGPKQTVTSPSGTSISSPSRAGARVFAKTAKNVLSPYENMRPTGVIPTGTPIKVLVNKTIIMPEAK